MLHLKYIFQNFFWYLVQLIETLRALVIFIIMIIL